MTTTILKDGLLILCGEVLTAIGLGSFFVILVAIEVRQRLNIL